MSAFSFITSFPALTKTFTAPSSCATAPWTYVDVGGSKPDSRSNPTSLPTLYRPVDLAVQLSTDAVTNSFDVDACLPTSYYEGVGHYSPGVCPHGQTTATEVNTAGTSIAICCPTGFDVTSENQACVSTYTTTTTVNYWGLPSGDEGTQIIRPGATIGPGVLYQGAIVLLQPSSTMKSSLTSTTAATGGSSATIASQTATQASPSATAVSIYQSSGPSNAVIIAISAVLGVAILVLLFLAQKFFKSRGAQRKSKGKTAYPIFSTVSSIFVLPFVVAVLTGITSCILADRRSWQEDIIRRWNSPDSVLRVVQVLSFIMRLCATIFGWSFVTDIGWLIMRHGEQPSQIMRTLDMTAIGGSYL